MNYSIETNTLKPIVTKAFIEVFNEDPKTVRVIRYRACRGGYVKILLNKKTSAYLNSLKEVPPTNERLVELMNKIKRQADMTGIRVYFRPTVEHIEVMMEYL